MIEFDVVPVPKPRMVHSSKWNPTPAISRYFAFKDELNYKANIKKFKLPDFFFVKFFVKTSDQSLWGEYHQGTPDVDNFLKAFMDALSDEDKTVHTIVASKIWGKDSKIQVFEGEEAKTTFCSDF